MEKAIEDLTQDYEQKLGEKEKVLEEKTKALEAQKRLVDELMRQLN